MKPGLSNEQIRRMYAAVHTAVRPDADACALEFARGLRVAMGGKPDGPVRREWLETESQFAGTEVRRSFRDRGRRYSARVSVGVDDVRDPWVGVTVWLGRGEEDQLIQVSMPGAPVLRLLDTGSAESVVRHVRDLQPYAAETARLAAPILLALAEDEVAPGLMDFVIPAPGSGDRRVRISFP
jgi:hypothetical protein